MRNLKLGLVAAAAVALSGCGYGFGPGLGVGVGYNSGYGGYYGNYGGYGYSPYADPYFGYGSRYSYGYGPYGYNYGGYGSPYGGGWYNGYYYPGSGYYVYDRDRTRRRLSDAELAQWRQRVSSTLADRIRERRGDTIGTQSVRRIRTDSVERAPRSTTRMSNGEGRERVRESLRQRIEQRRAERAARQRDDN
ncbi:hypothetical protein H9L13_06210 [Sphingomonas lutea]|uniref:Uncharacterized protein n=1 Tax=Sphingomonas lutea TaxID=1045317 RepID=A0A7G9SKR9_9SPHN|nr:hypothetical protein [Sphingomonas lutea]QNN68444.1 hypothetical protein H9L13_06210 [Sphingomonas lutea]